MFHAAIAGSNRIDGALQDFLTAGRLAAARAFRVLRDLRVLAGGDAVEFILAPEGQDALMSFRHPGLWSVTLEPEVTATDRAGGLILGDRALAAELEPARAAFAAHSRLSVIARAYAPHLAAWAQTGRDFEFPPGPLAAFAPTRRRRRISDETQIEDAAADPRNAGALTDEGRLIVWREDDLFAAAELVGLSEQAAQIRHIAAGFGVTEAAPTRRTPHAACA